MKKRCRVMSDELDGSEYSEMYVCMYVRMRTTNWRKLSGYDFFTRANERSFVFVVNNTGQASDSINT
jgi:hypothetical protein